MGATAAAISKHTLLMHCVNKQMDKANVEHKLSPSDLAKMKRVLDKKILQMSFEKPTNSETRKRPSAASMSRMAIPGVPHETIDKMLESVGKSSAHCANEMLEES
ncbi:hypothetical protein N7532_001197 [Penicillium argentinense]|uniref:Uncharacterized protein n=1 Tax=Penicillium argentinense TaxID=1131581 RepID=A0A9W9G3N0_9EURO|nr:uncharacterized protein N7532_001197 [Penicillium argentinense]KAJ5110662.1 hypothetical protein N7532_001197 [Penicillium argentinense]